MFSKAKFIQRAVLNLRGASRKVLYSVVMEMWVEIDRRLNIKAYKFLGVEWNETLNKNWCFPLQKPFDRLLWVDSFQLTLFVHWDYHAIQNLGWCVSWCVWHVCHCLTVDRWELAVWLSRLSQPSMVLSIVWDPPPRYFVSPYHAFNVFSSLSHFYNSQTFSWILPLRVGKNQLIYCSHPLFSFDLPPWILRFKWY